MSNSNLPPKPVVAMPCVYEAKNAHKCRATKRVEHKLRNKGNGSENGAQRLQLPIALSHLSLLQRKRKATEDKDTHQSQPAGKRIKANLSIPELLPPRPKQAAATPKISPMALKNITPPASAIVDGSVFYGGLAPIAPPSVLRWDKATRRFVVSERTQMTPDSAPVRAPPAINCASVQKRKRPGAGEPSSEELERGRKRMRVDVIHDGSEMEVDTTTNATNAKHRRGKRQRQIRKKAHNKTNLTMRLEDLIPHYIPGSRNFAQARVKEMKTLKAIPKRFMDLPTEIRQNIWDKVFEDESYKFTIKKDSKSGQVSDMIASPPPSFRCLFIHPTLAREVAEQMYKSMRVEINFGHLRPGATRLFMKQMGNTRLGREAHRVFFNKSLSLHKVNMGVFSKAREIVSTNWTIYGDQKMDEDDYLNNHINPEHVLQAPPSAPAKQKGLKERRFWKDQEAASQRYKRHMEGWCHPEAEDPNQTVKAADPNDPSSMIDVPVQVHKRPCPFQDKCLDLKNTKFCMVVKYKFGCIKGRHSRHKEALFDFYPGTDRIEQPKAPKSKFYNKTSK